MIQTKTTKAPDLRSSILGQRAAKCIENLLDRDFYILRRQVIEALGQSSNYCSGPKKY